MCLAPFHSIATGTPHQYSEFDFNRNKPRGYFDPKYVNINTAQPEKYVPPPLDVEIVGCIGHKSKGAIAVVQQNMRPQILSSFSMEGVNDIWSIKCRRMLSGAKNGEAYNDGEEYHKYLILSRNDNTMVKMKKIMSSTLVFFSDCSNDFFRLSKLVKNFKK